MKNIVLSLIFLSILTGIGIKKNVDQQNIKVTFETGRESVRGANDETPGDGNTANQTTKYGPDIFNATPGKKTVEISFPERKAQAIKTARKLADEFSLDQEMVLCTLNQESGIESHDPKSGTLKCGDNGASCGIAQIKLATWKRIRQHAGWDTEDIRWNDFESIRTMNYGITHGWQEHWTGYRTCRDMGFKK